ncbi:MAG TPA: D-amino-acid transaminase [Stellaceae bacterium]|nr:D-amino-acid transaminase [Stellaceae bacterium]
MSRIAYVAGQYLPHRQAGVHIEDRGYQFGDGVYEVIAVMGGHLVDEERHLRRLNRSLTELRINPPMCNAALKIVMREVIRRNGVDSGIVYLQVTRGVAPREHAFPKAAKPVLVITSRRSRPPDPRLGQAGIAVITIPDVRWQRCDIKSIALVANVLGKQQAREAGAYEAWQVDREGYVTEGTSTNAWIVTDDGAVVTRAADHSILNGVTRLAVFDIIHREGYRLVERPFTVAEAKAAREAFLTSTTADLLPVVRLDGAPVADGKPGPLSRKLREAYFAHATAAA